MYARILIITTSLQTSLTPLLFTPAFHICLANCYHSEPYSAIAHLHLKAQYCKAHIQINYLTSFYFWPQIPNKNSTPLYNPLHLKYAHFILL
jgi:hypothetical protein